MGAFYKRFNSVRPTLIATSKYSKYLLSFSAIVLAWAAFPSFAEATFIVPTNYTMLNGQTKPSEAASLPLWDKQYDGSGATTTDLALLSGGSGDLTDGVIAADNWNIVENAAGDGPYVGWLAIDTPITFFFDEPIAFTSLRIHADDADGFGGVSLPKSIVVTVGSTVLNFNVADVVDVSGAEPKWIPLDLRGLPASSAVVVSIVRADDSWALVSELQFSDDLIVPEPSTLGMLLLGCTALVGHRRGRRSEATLMHG